MSSIAVIYWSMTGNTQAMAEAIAKGAREAGAQVDVFSVDQVGVDQVLEYDQLALGCPAMGAEVLEESEFEPFFSQLEGRLSGKSVALFGSYGWGDGQWMRDWEERTASWWWIPGPTCLLYTSPSPRDRSLSRMPSSA